MIQNNLICICGHTKENHETNEDSPLCIDCANFGEGWNAMWHEFKLDNLKYIEQKYDEKTL